MRRGTQVGQAYVKATIDGDGMNEEIVDAVDGAGDDIDKKGREHGESYGDEFGDSLRVKFSHVADDAGDELNKRLADAGDDGGDEYGQHFERSLGKGTRRIGKNAGASIGDSLADEIEERTSRLIDSLEERLSNVSGNGSGGGPTSAGNQPASSRQFLYKEYDFYAMFENARVKLHEEATKKIEADERDFLKKQKEGYDDILKAEVKKTAFLGKFEAARARMHQHSNDVIFKDDQQLVKDQQRLYDRLQAEAIKRDADLWKVRRATADAYYKYASDLEAKRIDEQGRTIRRRPGDQGVDISGKIGNLLGAGSRNNALNLFGRSIENILGLLVSAKNGVKTFFDAFKTGFNSLEEGATFFQKSGAGFSSLGTSLSEAGASLVAAAPAVAAAIAVVTVALSAMASVVSALTALVVALAATIASALTGALLVLSAGLAAVVVAGGLLAGAFLSMTNAQKSLLKDAFQPLKAELVGIGQLMIQDMVPYFQTWSANLQQALLLVAPLAQVMGKAFGEAGNAMTRALSGPGFQNFFRALRDELPDITVNLSTAFGSFLNGVTGVFAALMPFVTRFSEYLVRVTDQFSDWANSAKGQNSIVDFAERAIESLKSLWGFIKETSGFIADLLFNKDSQKAGNDLFDAATKSLKHWRDKIEEFSKDGSLKKWFKDAKDFASDLKDVIGSLKDAFVKLDNSGVLDAVGKALSFMADQVDRLNKVLGPLVKYFGFVIPRVLGAVQSGFGILSSAIGGVTSAAKSAYDWVVKLIDKINNIPGVGGGGTMGGTQSEGNNGGGGTYRSMVTDPASLSTDAANTLISRSKAGSILRGPVAEPPSGTPGPTLAELIAIGNAAMNSNGGAGGSGPSGGGSSSSSGDSKDAEDKKKKWKNPYKKWALSLIKEGPGLAAILKAAMISVNKEINKALVEASKASSADEARSIIAAQMASIRDAAKEGVASARDALNTAAQNLAGASSKKEAERALKAVHRAQENLKLALSNQVKLNATAQYLAKQKVMTPEKVERLLNGLKVQNATLADYAAARARLAVQIEAANQKLEEAIRLRDSFADSVTNSTKAFGALTTAQASTIDGVEQALSAMDITSNLQSRLEKIKKFQDNLRILLANGLSNAAYQQILEAGVDGGSAYADALVQGGAGAVSQVNALVSQITGVADALGLEAADRLYQAGVDAAQGLVDGLNSLSDELDAAATALGNKIAKAIKKALGIKSPSTVLRGMMGAVGDGTVQGLDDQHNKVSASAARLASKIAVSPEVAAYAAQQGTAPVSGNDQRPIDLTIVTPTEDPHAVAMETLNELTGRL